MVSIKDFGIDKLPEEQRRELANQLWDSLRKADSPSPSEEQWDAETARRDAELEAHPERALSHEEFWDRLEGRK
ncbi:addiction module protein [Anatilimnocola floriformis]|uniref:addiction module protein n=1 Tax=Anatilimnocola floriformis TaxID=2948575 RepID=UPI0020C202B3|nr:addiction module protein [Anatilimnocola floriformis]